MFSDEITTSDAFLDMPIESQTLYFHLGMSADDDGFISNTKMIQRVIGAGDDSLKILFAKKFLIVFKTGICVVKHWRINNQIRKDRYTETKYVTEKSSLFIRENGAYTTNPEGAIPVPKGHFLPSGNQVATSGQPSIGKVSIGKVRLEEDSTEESNTPVVRDSSKDKDNYGEFKNVKLTKDENSKLIEKFGAKNTLDLIEELSGYIASKGKKYSSHYATILNWSRRKGQESSSNHKKIYVAQ